MLAASLLQGMCAGSTAASASYVEHDRDQNRADKIEQTAREQIDRVRQHSAGRALRNHEVFLRETVAPTPALLVEELFENDRPRPESG